MEERKKLDPIPFGSPFPESEEAPEGVITVRWQDAPAPLADVIPQIVYQELSGEQQHIQLFKPMSMEMMPNPNAAPKIYPLIVYVPGSAWMRQNVWLGLSKALEAVARGYAFAIVEYRPTEIAPFPAQVVDCKSAVRYLRKHASELGLDPDRVALWGDSSGGHTVALASITQNDYPNTEENAGPGCEVRCVADFFGVSDITEMVYYPSILPHYGLNIPEALLLGNRDVHENFEEAQKANPAAYLTADKPTPPFLMMHAAGDTIVPFNQSVLLYNRLKELGKEVTFYKLLGGDHGMGGFNSPEAIAITFDFFAKYLKE